MAFNPSALDERTLKQFVDRLLSLRKKQPLPEPSSWPPKRHQIQEEIAAVLGFSSWHAAVTNSKSPSKITRAENQIPKKTSEQINKLPMSPVESYQNMYDYFNKIISWVAEKGASDITFISEESVVAEYMGRQNKITEKVLSPSDLEEIDDEMMNQIYIPNNLVNLNDPNIVDLQNPV